MSEDLYTAKDSAREAGVEPPTIHVWVHRGLLTPAAYRGRIPLFRLGDVFTCEAERHRKHRRKS